MQAGVVLKVQIRMLEASHVIEPGKQVEGQGDSPNRTPKNKGSTTKSKY
jgi:hypothetical protein